MKAPNAPMRRAWLQALPMAWATSALLLLDESRLLYVLACLGCLGLAWTWLSGTRLAIARRAISVVLALAIPVQGFAVAAVEARGPAHVHPQRASAEHWHNEVRHHHHAAGEATLVDDGTRERQHSLATAEDKRVAFGGADSITPSQLAFPAFRRSYVPPTDPIAKSPSHVGAALVPPPRLLSASLS